MLNLIVKTLRDVCCAELVAERNPLGIEIYGVLR